MPNGFTSSTSSEREYHDDATSAYWLPKDEEEQQRLTVEHLALKELYEGNVLPSIKESLDFEKGICVLDVGCGSAVWIMDMIVDYPNCTFHGCDITDVTNKVLNMNQLVFNYGNVVNGLPYADNTFDFVHMRSFVLALREKEWPVAIKEVLRVTKPGGMIQFGELDLKLTEGRLNAYDKVQRAVHSTCNSREMNPRIAIELERLILKNNNVNILQSDYRECNMRKFKFNFHI
ncbi:unnamed protein product [Rhizopus stolonifer]